MVAIKPKEKIEDIFSRIIVLSQVRSGTSFVHRRIIREIEDLLKVPGVDVGQCHYGLALLYFFEGEHGRALELFRSALLYSPDQVSIHVAYINSLSESGSFAAAIKLLPGLVQKFPGQKSALECAIIVSYHALQISKVQQYLKLYDQLVVNDSAPKFRHYSESLMLTMQHIDKNSISEASLLGLLETAVDHLREENVVVRATTQAVLRDGRIIYSLLIDDNYEGCAEKSFGVAMALCEKHQDTHMDVISIVCKPLSDFQAVSL